MRSVKEVRRIADILFSFFALVGVFTFLGTIFFIVWASQRGLNITDESMSLVASQFPEDVKFGVTNAYSYTALLFHLVGQNIIALRLVRLFMSVSAGIVFYFGFSRVLFQYQLEVAQTILDKIAIAAFFCLGTLLAYSWFQPTPNYNSLNAFALTMSSGFLFCGLQECFDSTSLNKIKLPSIWFIIGLFISISLFVKFTTGALLLFIYGSVILLNTNYTSKMKIICFISMISGVFSWISAHFIFFQSPVLWWRLFRDGLDFAKTISGGYDAGALSRYFNDMSMLFVKAVSDVWIIHILLVLVLGFVKYLKSKGKNCNLLLPLGLLTLFVIACYLSYRHGLYMGGQNRWFDVSRFYFSWLLLLGNGYISSLIFIGKDDNRIESKYIVRTFLIIALLFCLPIAGSIGTGNPLYINILMNMAPWFALILLLLTHLSWVLSIRWIAPLGVIFFTSFASVQIVSGSLYGPYMLNAGLLEQTQTTEIGHPVTKLKLDPLTSEFYSGVRSLAYASGFKPGDDVIALYDLPGLVFALGGRSPAIPWYIGNPRKNPRGTSEKALSAVPRERIKRAFILQSSSSDRIMPDLAKFGVLFPDGYVFCGEHVNPYDPSKGTVRLWKPL
jgi:hypothetical protein